MDGAGRESESGAGEVRVVVRCTEAESSGQAVVLEVLVPPAQLIETLGDDGARERRFEVVHGTIAVETAGATHVVEAGGRLTIPGGAGYRLWNAGAEEAQFVCEVRPARELPSGISALLRDAVPTTPAASPKTTNTNFGGET